MKVVERVWESMITERRDVEAMQFGFIPGRGATHAVIIVTAPTRKVLGKGRPASIGWLKRRSDVY